VVRQAYIDADVVEVGDGLLDSQRRVGQQIFPANAPKKGGLATPSASINEN
jgi:hypothetical protein